VGPVHQLKNSSNFQNSLSMEGRYRLLIEAVTDYAIYMLDPSGIVSSWNPGAQRFKGYSAEEIVGQHFSRFYTEEDRARGLPATALATAASESKFEAEGWRVRKDGTRFWAHVVIDPIRSSDGELVGFAKITRDLTQQKLGEQELLKSEQQFRLLVQGVTDYALYMIDPRGHVSNWNFGAQRIKGYRPDEIIGRHFSQFYTEEDRAKNEPQAALDVAIREGRFEKEGWRVRKDGSRFWAHVVIDAIRDNTGALIGFAKITRDITERREAGQALDRAREALFQSQKMDAIGQLTGGVAHDFNNLLMAVLGSLELLGRRLPPEDERSRRLLDNAVEGAKRGATLTQRMLSFARRQELDTKPVDIGALVRGIGELLQRSLGSFVAIRTTIPDNLPPAQADANQLELAILNLCMNARDAMPEGGEIAVSARCETVAAGHKTGLSPGDYLCLSVRDHGDGMDPDTLAKAAEPFFTTKGIGKGTGLGLPMVHGMAEQVHGRLLLHSVPGQGTTAEIWLPVAQAGTAVTDTNTGGDAQAPAHRTLTILAVDDDALVLFNTVAMLEEQGHHVLEAMSGEAALALLRENKVDLVITDQAMPQMTGAQLIDTIRAQWPGLPVILATGYAELPAGMAQGTPKLSKPFAEAELAKIVADVLDVRA
jgi:PAS domain S-box-containing protein